MGKMEGMPQAAKLRMTTEQFRNEKLYETTMSLVGSMLDEGLISGDEYAEIDTKMVAKYRPVFGSLYSANRLTMGA